MKEKATIFIISIIAIVLIIVTFQSSYAFSGASGVSGTCDWVIDEDGNMEITASGADCTLSANEGGQMPWSEYSSDIKSIVIGQNVIANSDSSYLFSSLNNLESIDISNLDTSSVTNMQYMFNDCNNLTVLNAGSLDTSNVASQGIEGIFKGLGSAKEEGAKIILGNTFNQDYESVDAFPFKTYTKETANGLDESLYTLNEMKNETVASSSPITWIPAFSVTFNPNPTASKPAKIVELKPDDEEDVKVDSKTVIYRIGSKIDTTKLDAYRKNDELKRWLSIKDDESSGIIINKAAISTDSYGSNYNDIPDSNNNKVTLYANYIINGVMSDVVFIKKDAKYGSSVEGAEFTLNGYSYEGDCINETSTSDSSGKVIFKGASDEGIPVGIYKLKEKKPAENYNKNTHEYTVLVGEYEEGESYRECE